MQVMSLTIFYIRQSVQYLEYWIPQCIVLDPPFPVWRKTGSDINCELFLDSFDWMAKRQTFTYKLKKCEKWRSLFMRLQAKYVFVQECFLSKSIYQTKLQAVYRTSYPVFSKVSVPFWTEPMFQEEKTSTVAGLFHTNIEKTLKWITWVQMTRWTVTRREELVCTQFTRFF